MLMFSFRYEPWNVIAKPRHLGHHLINLPFLFLTVCFTLDYNCHQLMPHLLRYTMRLVIFTPLENMLSFARKSKYRSLKIQTPLKADIWIWWHMAVFEIRHVVSPKDIFIHLPISALYSFLRFVFCFSPRYQKLVYCLQQARSSDSSERLKTQCHLWLCFKIFYMN